MEIEAFVRFVGIGLFISIILFSGFNLINNNEHYKWSVKNGWVYRNGKKFFALGIWGIPGYETKPFQIDTDSANIAKYKKITRIFNLVYCQFGREQTYMARSVLMTGWDFFHWRMVKRFVGDSLYIPDRDKNGHIDYTEMRFIKDNIESYYKDYMRNQIVKPVLKRFAPFDFIWFLIDEPNTGFQNWAWHPAIIFKYAQEVRRRSPGRIILLDLFGSLKGDRLNYELIYAKKFSTLPDRLPVGIHSEQMEGDPKKLFTYNYAADGTSVYYFDTIRNKWRPRPWHLFQNKFYYNVFQAALLYNSGADVFSVNSYQDFYRYPEAAAIVVDAIKDACGKDKPVWLFFDGAAVAKPENVSENAYVKNIRCQMYLSLIHGATGILIWSKKDVSQTYFQLLVNVLREIKNNQFIFEGTTEKSGTLFKKVHFCIKITRNNQRFLILANSDKSSSYHLGEMNGQPVNANLKPLDVIVMQLASNKLN